MRKIILLLAVLLPAIAAKAQDTAQCDISVALTSPSANLVVPYGDTAFLSFTYTNHGPDVLPAGDTLFFVASGNIVLYAKLIQNLQVNSTLALNNIVYYFNPTQDSIALDICIRHIPQSVVQYTGGGHPVTTYIDNDTSNDASCVPIVLKGPAPNSISDQAVAAEELTLYPNPAIDKLQFDFHTNGGRKELKAVVKDIAGRVVMVKELGGGQQKYSLGVADLQPGIYFLELASGNRLARGKFVIAR